jgi:4-alpha-glucanotransferase
MSRDSADVWWERRVFDLSFQAGAPPDMFSTDGQNWGFPVYNWQLLKKEDYSWWRDRLAQAERWFQAIRIDHVLGFFRIWAIPEGDISGQRGHYRPARYLNQDDFANAGISSDRVTWLAEPHISENDLRELLGDSFATVTDALFFQLPNEELYLFRPDIEGEKAIIRVTEEGAVRDTLIEWFRDRALIDVGDDCFAPAWFAEECSRLGALADQERDALFGLFEMVQSESDSIWHDAGLERLEKLASGKNFLACAEDLGAVPPVVPIVLKQLEILGLRIPRWTRRWEEEGQPFVEPGNYEPLTVCTPSVHDTSTLRGWWEEENDRGAFWGTFGLQYTMPDSLGSADVEAILTEIYRRVASKLCISQLQDYLAMDPDLAPASVDEERINWPGTTSDRNWVYRMPVSVEALSQNQELTTAVRRVSESRA